MLSKLLCFALTGLALASNSTVTTTSSSNSTSSGGATTASASSGATTASASGNTTASGATTAAAQASGATTAAAQSSTATTAAATSSNNAATTAAAKSTSNTTSNVSKDAVAQKFDTAVTAKATVSDAIKSDKPKQVFFANTNALTTFDLLRKHVCGTAKVPICKSGWTGTCCVALADCDMAATGLVKGFKSAAGDAGLMGLMVATARRSLEAAPSRRLSGTVEVTYSATGKTELKTTASAAKTKADSAATSLKNDYSAAAKKMANDIAAGNAPEVATGVTVATASKGGLDAAGLSAGAAMTNSSTFTVTAAATAASSSSTSSAATLILSGFAFGGAFLALF